MIRISNRYLPIVEMLLNIKDEDDQLTIHLSHQLERPPYTFHIKVRDVLMPATALVVPMDGSTVEIDTQNGRVTVVTVPEHTVLKGVNVNGKYTDLNILWPM